MSTPFYLSYVALWALVVFLALVVVGLVRALQDARLAPVDAALPVSPEQELVDQPMPEFAVRDVDGEPITSKGLLGVPTALLFVSPDCSACAVTLHELDALKRRMSGNVVVVCRAVVDRCVSLAHHYDLSVPVVSDEDRHLSDLFRVTVPPMAVLIAADGTIESYGRPSSPDDLELQFSNHADVDGAGQAVPALAIHRVGETS